MHRRGRSSNRMDPFVPRLAELCRNALLSNKLADRMAFMKHTPRTLEQLMVAAKDVTSAKAFEDFTRHMRMFSAGPQHKHVGLLSGQRVQAFQNWLLVENYKRQLSDAQLLAVMRAEFPHAEGAVFTGSFDVGLDIVAGIRAHFNRDGHHGKSPKELGLPPSISYGRV